MSLNVFEYVNNLAVVIRKQGEVIFQQGDPSDGRMYFVAEGKLEVIREVEGHCHVLNKLVAGDFFGEMAILNSNPRSATITVMSKQAKLGYIDETMFVRIAKLNPLFHYSLLKLVIKRLGQIEEEIDRALRELSEKRGIAG